MAIKDYNRAIEINPTHAEFYYCNRGNVFSKIGNYTQAIKDFNKAINLSPKFEDAYYRRGDTYDKIGNHMQAIENYKISARLGGSEAREFLRDKGIRW
jgi:tetratricopeptide (TPR) repeat protein